MKFSFTKYAGAVAAAALLFAPVQDLLAQKRIVVIEEFTSATCPPCVAADPVLARVVKMEKGVISVRYHQGYPASGDPLHVNFPEGSDVHDFYGVTGIPAARVNGHYDIDPRDEASLLAGSKFDQMLAYPVTIKVTEDKSNLPTVNVSVEITSDMDLENYRLRTLVVSEHISMPELPTTLPNSNGQDEFEDAVLTMLPTWQGVDVTMAAGETKTLEFTYTVKDHRLWKETNHVVAYLQNKETLEIIQGGTSSEENGGEAGTMANTSIIRTMPLPGFHIMDPDESASAQVTIHNYSTSDMTYNVGKTTRTPNDWTATVEGGSNTITIPAGGSADVSLSLTKGESSGMGDIAIAFAEGTTNYSIPLQSILSKDVESIQFTDDNGDNTYSMAATVAATGRSSRYFDVPVAPVLDRLDELTNLKYVVWNTGVSGYIDGTEQFSAMDLLERGVSILFAGAAQTYGASGSDPAATLHSQLGFQYVRPIRLGYNDGIVRLKGVAGDPITDGFMEQGGLINYLTPYIRPIDSKATVIMSHSVSADSSVAVRSELSKARAVFFGFSPAIINNAAARTDLIDKALDWLEGFVPTPKPKAVMNIDPSEPLNFGEVLVGSSKEITIEITADTEAGLEISDIADFGDNFSNYGLSIVGLPASFPATPITLAENEKLSFKLRFAPTQLGEIGADDIVRLEITTNEEENGYYSIEIEGEAVPSTSVGESVSRNGEFSLTAGPNPFVGSSVVRYTLNGTGAKTVRMAVYNELGSEVAVLVNGVVLPGEHTVALDGTNLSAGMYRVVMTVDGESVALPVVSVK